MWFGSPEKGSTLMTQPSRFDSGQQTAMLSNPLESVQQILGTTTCFDLMRNSSKIILFETTIPFQQAFLALVEHETDVAPIWDPERRTFVSLMTTRDFYQIRKRRNSLGSPLQSQSISEILASEDLTFIQNEFQSIDAEDPVKELCGMLERLDVDYIPVVDPDEGNLVAVLGYMDILHLLVQLAQRFPSVFTSSIESLSFTMSSLPHSVSTGSTLADVISIMSDLHLSSIPVVDSNHRVVGLYQYSDTAFITKLSPSADISVLSTIDNQIMGDILEAQHSQSNHPSHNPTCQAKDSLKSVIELMVSMRVTKVVYVDANGGYLGIIRVQDILRSILPEQSSL